MQLGSVTVPPLALLAALGAAVLVVLVLWGVWRARSGPAPLPVAPPDIAGPQPCAEDWTGESAGGPADPLPPARPRTVADIVAERHVGTVAERHVGAVAERHVEPAAERHVGTVAERQSGAVAERHVEPAAERHSEPAAERHSEPVASPAAGAIAAGAAGTAGAYGERGAGAYAERDPGVDTGPLPGLPVRPGGSVPAGARRSATGAPGRHARESDRGGPLDELLAPADERPGSATRARTRGPVQPGAEDADPVTDDRSAIDRPDGASATDAAGAPVADASGPGGTTGPAVPVAHLHIADEHPDPAAAGTSAPGPGSSDPASSGPAGDPAISGPAGDPAPDGPEPRSDIVPPPADHPAAPLPPWSAERTVPAQEDLPSGGSPGTASPAPTGRDAASAQPARPAPPPLSEPVSRAVQQALAARAVQRARMRRGETDPTGPDPVPGEQQELPLAVVPSPPGDDDARDRLLAVLLADPVRALDATRTLDDSQHRIEELGDVLRRRRDELAGAVRHLNECGLDPAQIGRLSGMAPADVRTILDGEDAGR
ncbi:hypothetical protein GCM10009613_40920 [Pseudonocardia kongjuensis]|uniref:Uncharacterized protein n=1 Tax=Pseudonocardia kongjuensis TaxID=102227 RepID=A0ABN1XZH4_9PSEU